jgi:hypothetical protein
MYLLNIWVSPAAPQESLYTAAPAMPNSLKEDSNWGCC